MYFAEKRPTRCLYLVRKEKKKGGTIRPNKKAGTLTIRLVITILAQDHEEKKKYSMFRVRENINCP